MPCRGSRNPGLPVRFLVQDLLTQGDTFLADPHAGSGDEADTLLILALPQNEQQSAQVFEEDRCDLRNRERRGGEPIRHASSFLTSAKRTPIAVSTRLEEDPGSAANTNNRCSVRTSGLPRSAASRRAALTAASASPSPTRSPRVWAGGSNRRALASRTRSRVTPSRSNVFAATPTSNRPSSRCCVPATLPSACATAWAACRHVTRRGTNGKQRRHRHSLLRAGPRSAAGPSLSCLTPTRWWAPGCRSGCPPAPPSGMHWRSTSANWNYRPATTGQAGRTRTVPAFTAIRLTKEEPDFVPAASPRLPRSTSPRPLAEPSMNRPGVPRPAPRRTGARRSRPISARFGAGSVLRDFQAPVPRVLLSVTLAGPAPSGSASTPRRCQGCSRPPRHLPDQAALSYAALLRQGQRRYSLTSARINSASRRTG
jgi:hypothetical protein